MRQDDSKQRLEIVRSDPVPNPQGQRPFRMLDQVKALVDAREADPDLGFMARLLMLCSLPRTNPGDREKYARKNGPFTLVMFAGAHQKLPFGNLPRLLMAWISTEAVQTQSRELILGDSLSEFMRSLGIYSNSGRVHIRLRNQMRRLFQCHVQLVHEHEHGERFVSSQIADRGEFWWSERRPGERSLWQSKIVLSETFFNEIIHNPVPLDMNILKALKRSPLGLDLYMWLTYRTFSLDGPKRLSWPMLYRQFGVDPAQADDKRTVDAFPHRLPPGVEEDQDGLAGPGIPYRARAPARKYRRIGSAAVRVSDPAPEARPVVKDRPRAPQGGGASSGGETHEYHNGDKAENPHHGPNPGCPRGSILDAVRALRPEQASGRRTSIVPEMPPVPSLQTLERPSRDDKVPLTPFR